jgi:hypothetical protein
MAATKLVVGSWRGPNGALEISSLSANVVCLQLTGVTDQPAAVVIERTLAKQFAVAGRLATFWDLSELVNYHSDVRIFSTRVLLAHRKQIITMHTFTRSKLVAMGVSVANLALGGIITAHARRASFDAALNELLR